jgi:hypothetical protein
MTYRATWAIAAVLLLGSVMSARADTMPGSPRGLEALALCRSAAEQTDTSTRLTLLERGLALAEEAVEHDDADAAGHFAVFCNLGRRLQLHPLNPGNLFAVRRVRREIDRTLALAPDSAGVLTAKGTMLLELPRVLGGDASEGERLLRRALEVDPDFEDARRALEEHGYVVPPGASARREPARAP